MISHSIITRSSAGNKSIGQIDSYYQDAKDDYYAKENQPSQWQGKLAAELGLSGVVDKEKFIDLLAGKDPNNYHQQLRNTQFKNKSDNERLAIDLTFSAPKSISIESLVNNKGDVLAAHENAVTKTLAIIEEKAQARQRVGQLRVVETTGNLAIAKFRHETNRNLDPHLHTHAVIVNLTKREDGQYRALHNEEIVKHTKEFTKIYQGFLAKELKEQGYQLRITKDGFELAHINDNQIKAFSSRSKEVEIELEKKGLTRESANTDDKQAAALETRQRKNEKDIVQVRHGWKITANQAGIAGFKNEPEIASMDAVAGQRVQQKTFTEFDNSFNTGKNLKTNLFETEYLLHDYRQQYQQTKSQETGAEGGIASDRATERSGGAGRYGESVGRDSGSGTGGGIAKREGRTNTSTTNQAFTGNGTKFEQAGEDQYGGLGNSRALYGYGFSQEANITETFGQQTNKQRDSEGAEDIGDNMRALPRITMANIATSSHLFLPVDQEILFQQYRTEYAPGLRGDSNRFGNDEPRVNDGGESLDDILAMDNQLSDSLKEQWQLSWKESIADMSSNDLNHDELFINSVDELKTYAVFHLTDKDHIIEHNKLKSLLVEKGLGFIDATEVDQIIKEMKDEKIIIATDAMYKLNGKLYTDYDLKDHLGIYDDVEISQFNRFLEKNGVEKVETIYTTQRAIDVDLNIIEKLENSKGTNKPAYNVKDANVQLDKTTLNKEQRACAEMVLTSNDAVLGIQGYAGTGKSFMVSKTKEILEEQGKELHIFAPYAAQVKNLQADGLEANTVAKFLLSQKMQKKLDENSVIVIDEAGVLNSKQMSQILNLREKIGCQVVLLGDTAQTKAVEAGTPFELLQKHGMQTGVMKDIQRQKDEQLREAVIKSVQGDYKTSVDMLKDLYEVEKLEDRHKAIVKKYMSINENERENTLIVSGTNKDRRSINELIREDIGVKGKGVIFDKLVQNDLSQYECSLAIHYNNGDWVTFNKVNKKDDIEANKAYQVVGRDLKENTLLVKDEENEVRSIKLTKGKQATSYTEEKIELSVGDKVRITKTDKDKGVSTGDLFEVKSISKDTGEAYAEDKTGKGYTFNANDKQHLDHAYAMTVHASQGLTFNEVICDFNTKSQTLSQETYYVGVSRARNKAHIFTNSIEEMPSKISQTATKHNATELFDSNIDNKIYNDKITTDTIKENQNVAILDMASLKKEEAVKIKDFVDNYSSNTELATFIVNKCGNSAEFLNQNNSVELQAGGVDSNFGEGIRKAIVGQIQADSDTNENLESTIKQSVAWRDVEQLEMINDAVKYIQGNGDVNMQNVNKVLENYITNKVLEEYSSFEQSTTKDKTLDIHFDNELKKDNPLEEYFKQFIEPQLEKIGLAFDKTSNSAIDESYFNANLSLIKDGVQSPSTYSASLRMNEDGKLQLNIEKYTNLDHGQKGGVDVIQHIFDMNEIENGQINFGKKAYEIAVKRGHQTSNGIDDFDGKTISKTNNEHIAESLYESAVSSVYLKSATLKLNGRELANSSERDNGIELG